jgi:soluble lytic murein transglycosylase-like protein
LAKAQAARTLQAAQVKAALMNYDSFDYESLIRERCDALGCDANQLIRVMYCESGGRANAVNRQGSGASGLFQFMPRTFSANAARIGLAGASIWDARAQIYVATYMFANGQAWQWSCK